MKKSLITNPKSLITILLLATANLAQAKPNIVLIVGDDVGFSDLGAYGSEIHTPNLDQLAATGQIFSNYHTTASCSPTRSMLMTGVDNHRNGLGNMHIITPDEHKNQPGYEGYLNDNVVTIATLLHDNGYHTYHTGKWHLGKAPERRPYNRGFERTIALGNTGADNWEQRPYLPHDDKAHWYADGKEHQLPDDFYSSQYFVDKTIEFIENNKNTGQPFFSYIGFQAVHIPLQAPAEFVQKYEKTYQQGWHQLREQRRDNAVKKGLIPAGTPVVDMPSTNNWDSLSDEQRAYQQKNMAVYAGMLDAMDFHIGRLIQYLKSTGEFDNTVFIFVSDNGAEPSDPLGNWPMKQWLKINYSLDIDDLGNKGAYAAIGPSWASAAASPGRDFKFWAGEGGVRVPLVISWPAKFAANKIQHSFAHVKDIVPTILELTGTANHNGQYQNRSIEKITGSSLVPVLTGKNAYTHAPNKPIGYELAGNAALYKGDYKIMKNLPPQGDGNWRLYNIVTDPGETTNLAAEKPQLFAEMQADYQAYAKANNVLEMPVGYYHLDHLQTAGIKAFVKRWWVYAALLILSLLVVGAALKSFIRK